MGKRNRKKKTEDVDVTEEYQEPIPTGIYAWKEDEKEEVIPESPEQPDMKNTNITEPEKPPVEPTQTPKETADPRYTLLKDSLQQIIDGSPSFEKVKANPWLYLEWRNQIKGLVQ